MGILYTRYCYNSEINYPSVSTSIINEEEKKELTKDEKIENENRTYLQIVLESNRILKERQKINKNARDKWLESKNKYNK